MKKIASFGYCINPEHKVVEIFQKEDGSYCVCIDNLCSSKTFTDLSSAEAMWECLDEVTKTYFELSNVDFTA